MPRNTSNMSNLRDLRKKRGALANERAKLKGEARELRTAERDAKNSVLGEYLEAGNFENTHGMVRRVKPRWMPRADSELRKVMETWREECRVYDEARKRLIKQKIELLYSLQNRAEDLTQFISINFGKGEK